MAELTKDWQDYETGKNYNNLTNFDKTVKGNWEFYIGNQWHNLETKSNLPKPVFNILKRILTFFVASLTASDKTINISAVDIMLDDSDPTDNTNVIGITNTTIKNLLDKMKFDHKRREALTSAGVAGITPVHFYWDRSKRPYGSGLGVYDNIQGEIDCELLDPRNIFFMNPSLKDAQKQPKIIIHGKDTIENLREEAKKNGVSGSDLDLIVQDDEEDKMSGEYAKAGYIITYTRDKNGEILASKSCRNVYIYKDVKTGLTRYPIAILPWEKGNDDYHGRALITGILPNQIFINRMFAMVMRHLMFSAFPKPVYNKNMIPQWNNEIGEAIAINAPLSEGFNIRNVAGYISPETMSADIINCIELAMQYTKETLGISDASLGNINPTNTSAIIAVQKSSAIPLENISGNEDEFYEEVALILLDFIGTYYGVRPVVVGDDEVTTLYDFDFSILKDLGLNVKIQSGESTYWSEIAQTQTLDNLLNGGVLDVLDYLERVPTELIPEKDALIEKIKAKQEEQAMMQQMMQPQVSEEELIPTQV